MENFNRLWVGLCLGALLPLAMTAAFSAALVGRYGGEFSATFLSLVANKLLIFKTFIVAVSPNLILTFFCYKAQFWRICSGLIATTLICFMVVVYFI